MVVTCFFIDTAHNIIEYIEIISRILKDGGVSPSVCIEQKFLLFHIVIIPWLIHATGLDKHGSPTISLC